MGVQYRGEPEFVIEGNPSGIRGRVATMKTCSESFDQVGESLGGVETEHWVGKAADRFRSRLEEEPRRWTGVAGGFRSAAAALEGYAAALEAAQQAAQVCKENYEEGKRVSATAKAEYDRDVSEGFQKKAAWEAQNGPGTYTLTITPFTDPGQALRDRAVADFQAVIEELEKTGSDTEQAVAQAHADADPTRQWPNKTGTASQGGASVSAVGPEDKKDEVLGKLDSKIELDWRAMTKEERKKVLQAIVDEEFAKEGMKAPKITFEDIEPDSTWGDWNENDKVLRIDQSLLNDPWEYDSNAKIGCDPRSAINVAVHEARHARQCEIIRDTDVGFSDWLWGNEKEEELKKHGATREEVEAWKAEYHRPFWADWGKSEEEKEKEYWDQEIEKDARKAGRDFVNSMTPEDFEKYKRKAGVK